MNCSRREFFQLSAAAVASAWLGRAEGGRGGEQILWRAPSKSAVEILRFGASGRSAQPKPPFRFVEEDHGGSNPKIKITDAKGAQWILKWGKEVHSEAFSTRLAASAGYFVRTAIYLKEGRIDGVGDLKRAKSCVDSSGRFENAVAKLIALDQPYAEGVNWAWNKNPFLDSPQGLQRLNGLKVIMMLTSNWDNKDASDHTAGANTAIYEEQKGNRKSYLYAFDDWGATMGRWGGIVSRSKWDAEGFAEQTPELILGVDDDGYLEWGFNGKDASDLKEGIRPEDLRWLLRFFRGVGGDEIQISLSECGATPVENQFFTDAMVARFEQLRKYAAT